jgi:GNAT superfamily N-acetyltransferase
MQRVDPEIRLLQAEDIPQIARAFEELRWHKPKALYERYLMEQSLNMRVCYVAFVDGQFAGYLTICWSSTYESFREQKIPEIVDFILLPQFRRRRIGTKLMDLAESEIAKVSPIAGIGVGMTPDYGAAQRLYVLRGYIPDGCGLHWRNHYVQFREEISVDDDLALYFTKELK